jgi:hypothetical protein
MRIDENGNVGIGTTSSANWRLRVDGRIHAGDGFDSTAYGIIQITRPAAQGTGFHQTFIRSGNAVFGMGFLSSSNTFGMHHGLDNTGSLGIFIDNAGNVGVGARAPGYKLTVVDTMQVTNAANDVMGLFSGTYGNYMMLGAWNAAGATSKNLVLNQFGGNVAIGGNTNMNNKLEVIGGGLRVQGIYSGTPTGEGLEFGYESAVSYITSYNRVAPGYRAMIFDFSYGVMNARTADMYFVTIGSFPIYFYTNNAQRAYFSNGGVFSPSTDNTYDMGFSGSVRWRNLYVINTPVGQSDRNAKDQIVDSPLGLDFVKTLRPVSYKWKPRNVTDIVRVNITVTRTDENGTVYNATEEKDEHRTRLTSNDRRHYGFIAQDILGSLDTFNVSTMDFGGLTDAAVSDPSLANSTSRYGLRYDEFIPIVTKAVQELDTKTTPQAVETGLPTSTDCRPGEQRFDETYLYMCVLPGVWRGLAWSI